MKELEVIMVTNDKNILGKACLTPDCHGFISKVEIFKKDGKSLLLEDAELSDR